MRHGRYRCCPTGGATHERVRLVTSPTGVLPSVDHHVHIFSDTSRALLEAEIGRSLPALGADELIGVMDRDGMERAAVLSTAYFFARPDGSASPDAEALARENDYVEEKIRRYSGRLVGFFSINPLHPSSNEEIARCADTNSFAGLKLHLANSDVDLRNDGHTDALAATFAEADRLGLVVVVHLRTRRPDYGREDMQVFIDHVLVGTQKFAVGTTASFSVAGGSHLLGALAVDGRFSWGAETVNVPAGGEYTAQFACQ